MFNRVYFKEVTIKKSSKKTGTPGEVGLKRNPQVFMRPGDTVEVEVSQIGVLTNKIKAV
ncbi:fumarylacetoacetate hydrolase family protein [Peribacillus butanolivorans]|uniref:fumarylacetoacetate hydrolase family protein n=1 Tax=Peribacillus butanolivorans TaxID=421767 RepID=UPI0037C5965A